MKKRSVVSVKGLVGALALALVAATPVFAFEVGTCEIYPLPEHRHKTGWEEYATAQAYEEGICGFQKDMKQAAKWYRKAAEKNNADAEWALVGMYLNGQGVPKDVDVAIEWCRRAADHGHEKAKQLLKESLGE